MVANVGLGREREREEGFGWIRVFIRTKGKERE